MLLCPITLFMLNSINQLTESEFSLVKLFAKLRFHISTVYVCVCGGLFSVFKFLVEVVMWWKQIATKSV